MSRKKKKTGGDPRKRAVDNDYFPLPLGPARTLIQLLERPETAQTAELASFLSDWPYSMDAAEEPGGRISLRHLATSTGQTILEVAEWTVALEDNNLLMWQEVDNAYWMLTPAPAP